MVIKFSTSGVSVRARLKTFPVGWVGGEKLGLKLNSAQLGLEAWAELGKIRIITMLTLVVKLMRGFIESSETNKYLTIIHCLDTKLKRYM